MNCKYTCSKCGRRFDKFSGYLVNLSPSALEWYYTLPWIKEWFKTHKHSILCSDCIESLHGSLTAKDFKYKRGFWLISNLCYIARKCNHIKFLSIASTFDSKGISKFPCTLKGWSEIKELFSTL